MGKVNVLIAPWGRVAVKALRFTSIRLMVVNISKSVQWADKHLCCSVCRRREI